MRWSGLAILDATSLERERLSTNENDDDQIFLYRAKTGVPVYVVIPNEVGEALRTLPNSQPRYSSGRAMATRRCWIGRISQICRHLKFFTKGRIILHNSYTARIDESISN
jgi:hypothetical protein